jgi:hypothetical protein
MRIWSNGLSVDAQQNCLTTIFFYGEAHLINQSLNRQSHPKTEKASKLTTTNLPITKQQQAKANVMTAWMIDSKPAPNRGYH